MTTRRRTEGRGDGHKGPEEEGVQDYREEPQERLGEIDVIAEEGGCLVFVEVKKRNTERFGEAICAIDEQKKRHLVKAALFYMKMHDCFDRSVRFDVMGIDNERIKIVKNAFLVEESHA